MKISKSTSRLGFQAVDYLVPGLSQSLSDENLATLANLAGKVHSGTRPRLTSSDFYGRSEPIFLEPITGKKTVRVLKLQLKKRPTEVFKALIWNALYSRNRFKIGHWYVLWHLFERTLAKSNWSLGLLMVLRLTTEKSGKALNQNLRSVRTVAANALNSKEASTNLCHEIEKLLGITLGTNQMDLEDYLSLFIGTHTFKTPPDPIRIGVGYKDKGHLPPVRPEYTGEVPNEFNQVIDAYKALLDKSDLCDTILGNYTSKKLEKKRQELRTLLLDPKKLLRI